MIFSKRHRNLYFFSLFILMMLISSCTPAPKSSTQLLITSVLPSPTSPVAANTPVPSPVIKTVSTLSSQSPVEVSLEKECIPIEDKMPADLVLSGVWLRGQGKPYLENLDEHTKYEVPLKGGSILNTYPSAGDISISPDGKHLAYIDSYLDSTFRFEKRILRIINSAGYSLPMDYWTADWQSIIGWLDNRNLALSLGLNNEGDLEFIILNPFTGSWKKFEQPQWLKDNHPRWFFYIPTIDWLMDYSNSPHRVLKDVKTGNIIWQTDHEGGFTWSRDGSTVVVDSASFVDVISKDEQVMEFDIRKLEMESWDKLALSSNGKKLFFSAYYPEKFFFLDLNKSKIHGLCKNDYELTNISSPFWSPDNRFVVLSVDDSGYYYAYNPFDLLIDTEQLRAYKLITKRYQERLVWRAKP